MNIEKHPGPFSGPDAELARACAMAVIPFYGNDDPETHKRIMKDGVWNDHVAVQAALAAIHHLRSNSPAAETRKEREARWGLEHTWDGPRVLVGGMFEVDTCSVCGADTSQQTPCAPKQVQGEE